MAEKTLLQKLLAKAGNRMLLLNAPQGYAEYFSDLPDKATIETTMSDPFDWALAFTNSRAEVEQLAPGLLAAAKPSALVWLAYPKKSGKVKPDINRDTLHALVETYGWTGVSLVAIDDQWAAMRFRPQEEVKRK